MDLVCIGAACGELWVWITLRGWYNIRILGLLFAGLPFVVDVFFGIMTWGWFGGVLDQCLRTLGLVLCLLSRICLVGCLASLLRCVCGIMCGWVCGFYTCYTGLGGLLLAGFWNLGWRGVWCLCWFALG